METPALGDLIHGVGNNELKWKLMQSGKFVTEFVRPAYEMSEDELADIINDLSDALFRCWTKKLWTEQDVVPDPDDWNAAYEMTKPILVVLQRSLIIRLDSLGANCDVRTRNEMQQQLGICSLCLDPKLVSDVTGIAE